MKPKIIFCYLCGSKDISKKVIRGRWAHECNQCHVIVFETEIKVQALNELQENELRANLSTADEQSEKVAPCGHPNSFWKTEVNGEAWCTLCTVGDLAIDLNESHRAMAAAMEGYLRMRETAQHVDAQAAAMRSFIEKLNEWLGKNPDWDLYFEPPWNREMHAALKEKAGSDLLLRFQLTEAALAIALDYIPELKANDRTWTNVQKDYNLNQVMEQLAKAKGEQW